MRISMDRRDGGRNSGSFVLSRVVTAIPRLICSFCCTQTTYYIYLSEYHQYNSAVKTTTFPYTKYFNLNKRCQITALRACICIETWTFLVRRVRLLNIRSSATTEYLKKHEKCNNIRMYNVYLHGTFATIYYLDNIWLLSSSTSIFSILLGY